MSTRAMTGTVRTKWLACGIIAGMVRVLAALAAWLGGTALAVCLAWFGAGMVVRNTTASPGLPVITALPPAVSVTAAPAPPPPAPGGPAARSPSPAASPSARPSRTAAAPAGTVRSYMLDGGQVTLLMTAGSAKLVTAVPAAGFAVQTWSGPDWLRVDFSAGTQVSTLIASWNGTAPSVTVTN
jgi:hypothetical protein